MVAATDLIGVVVLLFVAFVALLVLFFDALSRVLVGAVAALARAPWRGGQLILNRLRHKTSAGSNAGGKSPVRHGQRVAGSAGTRGL